MKFRTKIILASCIAALLFLAAICGFTLYYYSHPPAVKAFIEKSIARTTGTLFEIQSLSYSIKPLRIRAKGIRFKPGENLRGFYMEIQDVSADMALEGPFGHKRLAFKSLKVDGFSFRVSPDFLLPGMRRETGSFSFISRVAKRLVSLFLFRDIQFQAVQIVNGDILAQLHHQAIRISGIRGHLNTDRRIEISCAARFQWPYQNIQLTAPHLLITTDRALSFIDPEINCLLTATKATFQGPDADIERIGVTARLTYHHTNKTVTVASMNLHVEGATLDRIGATINSMKVKTNLVYNHNFKKVTVESLDLSSDGTVLKQPREMKGVSLDLHLNTKGSFDLRDRKLNVSHFHMSIHDILKLTGKGDAYFGSKAHVGLEHLDGTLLPRNVLPLVPARLKKALAHLNLSGAIPFSGKINGIKANNEWNCRCDLKVMLKENPFSYTTEEMKVRGRFSGAIRAQGKLPDINIAAMVKSNGTTFSSKGIVINPFTMGLSISGTYPVFEIEELKANLPKTDVSLKEKKILIDDIEVGIQKGTLNAEKRALDFPEIRLNSSLAKNILLSLRIDRDKVDIAVQGKQTNLLESALSLGLLPSDWQFNGLDSIRITATQKEKQEWLFTSELAFQAFGFESPDSGCAGEKIALNMKMGGEIDLKSAVIAANTAFEIASGEILYDRFYLNLNNNAFSSFCKARYDAAKKRLQVSDVKVGLKDILELHMHGMLFHHPTNQRIDFSVDMPGTSLKPVFDHFVLEPFKAESPFISALDMGGSISGGLRFTGTMKDWMARGRFLWHEGDMTSIDHHLSFKGIELDLPVWYQTQKGRIIGETAKGQLSIGSMTLPLLPEQPLAIKLDAGPNALSVKAPTVLSVPGGTVRVGSIAAKDIFGSHRSIETSLTMNAVDIKPALSRIFSQPVQGTISGKLDPIQFEGGRLSAHGKIKANVFNGQVIVSDLGVSGMVRSTPVFRLSAGWNALHLAEITAGTSFGKIEGVLKGHIKGLEIAYGQPQKFDLLLETVKTKGVAQKISVRAVDNIARIGGGQSPFVGLAGGFAALFREFPYRKIGMRASLENDAFRIHGTIKEGGHEYLVKRGGFSGVDVINQNPGSRVSFKDMVKRIKRITAKGGGPVIK